MFKLEVKGKRKVNEKENEEKKKCKKQEKNFILPEKASHLKLLLNLHMDTHI